MQHLLDCDSKEFEELIEFCKKQNDDIFFPLYQLSARANCPFDQLLLRPVDDLLDDFPEFGEQWRKVDSSLQKEKPNLEYRSCNEATIWHTRKLIETKYRYKYTYPSNLTSLFKLSENLGRTNAF
jgi:hypothetical protein